MPDQFILSPDQEIAIEQCLDALKDKGEAILVGAAGTGKTTVMQTLVEPHSGNVLFFAPTGKAAVRLAEVVGEAKTIHSAFFGAVKEESSDDDDTDTEGMTEEEKELFAKAKAKAKAAKPRKVTLVFSEPHPPEGACSSSLIVVDEASMVNEWLAGVIREQCAEVGASILWVGDHYQLPPVEGKWGADLENADGELSTVHRQAADAPALGLATAIREDRVESFTHWGGDCTMHHVNLARAAHWRFRAGKPHPKTGEIASDDRVVLTFTNRVRREVNRLVRKFEGYGASPEVGEIMLCTFNARSIGLWNGQQCKLTSVRLCPELTDFLKSPVYWVELEDRKGEFLIAPRAFESPRRDISARVWYREFWAPLWNRDKSWQRCLDLAWSDATLDDWQDKIRSQGIQMTWGYCLTVHKSQGSQFAEVGFIECPTYRRMQRRDYGFWKRLGYTAITRTEAVLRLFVLK
jgi:exodeoxyribonuclease-5